ncbi:PIR Superfamily Protein [Plasmodium ovale wallikeri]|uniref:PIR Superfamily Protein n=2 Tax=Plasmodium ovale TaxID=36330 RepID=A0A1A8YIM6_PLAOA|nr:PIR Superfamily Protein [Plasmodium ovale wallikeri]SBT57189.1 PIR Superfamily Protein [Plasmodium ovale wallikeri]SBT72729.1 PIR protein [Plasmodium ovale]
MKESPYSFIGSYDVYKSAFEKDYEDGGFQDTSDCQNIATTYLGGDNNRCTQIVNYLNYLDSYDESYICEGCKYLNYLLYNEIHKKLGHGHNILQFYDKLKDSYDYYFNTYIFDIYVKEISEDIFQKIQNLIELYDHFKKIKSANIQIIGETCKNAQSFANAYLLHVKKCYESYDKDFCAELEKFRDQYNLRMTNVTSCAGLQTFLPSTINVNLLAILSPFVVIIGIPFIFFILFKFTPFGPWIMPRMRSIKMIRNYLSPESPEVQHNYQDTNIYEEEKMYNIAYYST